MVTEMLEAARELGFGEGGPRRWSAAAREGDGEKGGGGKARVRIGVEIIRGEGKGFVRRRGNRGMARRC